MVTVFNLSDLSEQTFSCDPRAAVIAAHAQSQGDWNTFEYEARYGDLVRLSGEGNRTVSCGDFAAVMVGSRDVRSLLPKLKRGDIVTVGRYKWLVTNARGTDIYVTKHGTKGRKLYKLYAIADTVVNVMEVTPGSGSFMEGTSPVATGTSTGDPLNWEQIIIKPTHT